MMPDVVRVSDLTSRTGVTIESRDDHLSMDAALLRGTFLHRELRQGLFIHASDVFEEADFIANSAQHAGVSCIFFLSGEVEVDIGERRFAFRGGETLSEGMIVASRHSESFRRRSHGHQRIRHLVVSATPEWLDRDGLDGVTDHRPVKTLLDDHMANRSWRITPELSGLVRRILSFPTASSLARDLMIESIAVGIVAEALSAATNQQPLPALGGPTRSELVRLGRARSYIEDAAGGRLDVESIAREAGLSVSSLQRLFKANYGLPVIDFVRQARLEEARQKLIRGECTVGEAALDAGYASAANFATAFKRRFGVTPREARRRG